MMGALNKLFLGKFERPLQHYFKSSKGKFLPTFWGCSSRNRCRSARLNKTWERHCMIFLFITPDLGSTFPNSEIQHYSLKVCLTILPTKQYKFENISINRCCSSFFSLLIISTLSPIVWILIDSHSSMGKIPQRKKRQKMDSKPICK